MEKENGIGRVEIILEWGGFELRRERGDRRWYTSELVFKFSIHGRALKVFGISCIPRE